MDGTFPYMVWTLLKLWDFRPWTYPFSLLKKGIVWIYTICMQNMDIEVWNYTILYKKWVKSVNSVLEQCTCMVYFLEMADSLGKC